MSKPTITKIGGKVPDKPPPMFEHDCKECVYLGHVSINGREADIYVCKDGVTQRMDSLIWRHGNEPGDYGTIFASYVTPLCPFSSVALALYVNHLGATGATTFFNGGFHKGSVMVLNLL